jgi:ketopantoate reductase
MPARDVLPNFRIAIVGAGAVGTFYGAKLAYHGSNVHFLMRSDLATVRKRWRKLVWNIPFNGLSVTAGGVDTAEILADDNLRAKALALMDEVIAGANKCGHFLPSAEALAQMKRTEEMGKYKPSTLVDFESGKPLEIEAIWGEPLRRANAAGAKMPRLESLYFQLKELDRHNRREVCPQSHVIRLTS